MPGKAYIGSLCPSFMSEEVWTYVANQSKGPASFLFLLNDETRLIHLIPLLRHWSLCPDTEASLRYTHRKIREADATYPSFVAWMKEGYHLAAQIKTKLASAYPSTGFNFLAEAVSFKKKKKKTTLSPLMKTLLKHSSPTDFDKATYTERASEGEGYFDQPSETVCLKTTDLSCQILNYTFNVAGQLPSFVEKGARSYGVELELSSKYPPAVLSYILTKVEPKQEQFFLFKSDVSVHTSSEYPFAIELVTSPCSRRFLQKNFFLFFDKVKKVLGDDAFAIDKGESNGIHIHVAKEHFTSRHTKKFLFFWNTLPVQSLKDLVGREPTHYCRQDNPTYGARKISRVLNKDYLERSAAHERKTFTLEVRVFAGIPTYKHLKKCLSLVENSCDYTKAMPYSLMKAATEDKMLSDFLLKKGSV